jgi:superfamily I DNA and/or RNA helicase
MSENSLPWYEIVSFYRDITKFTDEKFFDLYSSQFTYISEGDYVCQSYKDKFEINKPAFFDNAFFKNYLKDYESGDQAQAYLGIFPLQKSRGKYSMTTCLLFTPVKLIEEGRVYFLKPENSSWSSTPELNTLFRDKGYSSEEILDIQDELDKYTDYQEIKDFLENKVDSGIQASVLDDSRAIFFSEHDSTRSYNVNLYKDYDALKKILKEDSNLIGGFELLENYYFKNIDNPVSNDGQVQRIIPLNKEQEQVVASALGSKGITVVKGPPGCGKSQVVLSTIMNAWSQGKSVLFASNNNEAVDVVVERLEKYQNSFPIAVRAGSAKRSTLKENLIKILNLNEATLEDERNQVKEIEEQNIKKRDVLKSLLNEGKPQAIFEQLNILEDLLDKVKTQNRKFQSYQDQLNKKINEKGLQIFENNEISVERIKLNINESLSQEFLSNLVDYLGNKEESLSILTSLNLDKKKHSEQENLYREKIGLLQNQLNIKSDFDILVSSSFPEDTEVLFSKLLAIIKDIVQINFEDNNLSQLLCQSNLLNEIRTKDKADNAKEGLLEIRTAIQEIRSEHANSLHSIQEYISQKRILNKNLENKKIVYDDIINIEICRKWIKVNQELKLLELDSNYLRKLSLKIKKSLYKKKIYSYLNNYIAFLLEKENFTETSILEDFIEKAVIEIIEFHDFEERNKEIKIEFEIIEKEVIEVNNKLVKLPGMKVKLEADLINVEDLFGVIDYLESEYIRISSYYNSKTKLNSLKSLFKKLTKYAEEQISLTILSEIFSNHLEVKIDTFFNSVDEDTILDKLNVIRKLNDSLDASFLKEILQLEKLCDEYNGNAAKLAKANESFQSIVKDTLSNLPKSFAVIEKEDLTLETINNNFQYLDNNVTELNEALICYKEKVEANEQELVSLSEQIENQKQELQKEVGNFETKENLKIEKISIRDVGSALLTVEKAKKLYDPENLEQKIALIDQSLSEQIFQKAKEEWYQKILNDRDLRLSVQKLLDTYKQRTSITESSYEYFKDSLKAIPVWTTTMQSAQSIPLIENLFDVLIVDEATQCSLNNFIPLMYRAKSVMVLGDKDQLEAITEDIDQAVENSLVSKYHLEEYLSLFRYRGKNVYDLIRDIASRQEASPEIMLKEHYRSHPLIIGFSNKHIYEDNLEMRRDPALITRDDVGIIGYDIKGEAERKYKSYINTEEAEAVVNKVKDLIKLPDSQSIGVVTPYRKQADLIENLLQKNGLPSLLVGAAHKFQGNERDIMLYSTVISSGMDSRWSQNKNLVNVAITRARDTLYLFSNFSDILSSDDLVEGKPGIIKELIKYTKTIEKLRQADPNALELYSWLILRNWDINVRQFEPIVFEISMSHNKSPIICVIGSENMINSFDDSRDLREGYSVEKIISENIPNEKFTIIRRLANMNEKPITLDEFEFHI